MDKHGSEGLLSLPDSPWLPKNHSSKNISVEEIEEEIEEEIVEEVQEFEEDVGEKIMEEAQELLELEKEIREEVQESADKVEDNIMEVVQEQPSTSSSQNYYCTPFNEMNRAYETNIYALEQERKEKDTLAKTLKMERAEKNSLRVELELLKVQMADLKKSLKEHQRRKAKLEGTITEMTADLEEDKKVIEELKNDLEASSLQHKKERAEHDKVSCAEIKALKDRLTEQQEESLGKDNDIQALHFNIHCLQSDIEAKDKIVSSLQEKVNQRTSDLKDERKKTCNLQRDYDAGVSQKQKEAEVLDHVTQENKQLTSQNKRLRGEFAAALSEWQLDIKQYKEDREARSRFEEAIKNEKALFLRAYEKIQTQEKGLSEKTLALEKSLAAEEFLRSALKNEKKLCEQMVLEKQDAVNHLTILSSQLREASASSEHLMYDMQTLRMENADIGDKFKAMETEYDRTKSQHRSLSECHEEMMSKKNHMISELQCMVHELRARQSESKTTQPELEDTLKQEKTRNSALQHRVDQMSSALEKEKSMCGKYSIKLQRALTKLLETLEEKQKVAVALQKAQDSYSRLQEQQLATSNLQFGHNSDTELRLKWQHMALDESTKALHHLQKEYTDLNRRHSHINSDYRELLKTHSDLQIRYERLIYLSSK